MYYDNIRVKCVIWCVNMPFWNLVMGAIGPIVTGIWGDSEAWKRQTRRWWSNAICNNNEVGADAEC